MHYILYSFICFVLFSTSVFAQQNTGLSLVAPSGNSIPLVDNRFYEEDDLNYPLSKDNLQDNLQYGLLLKRFEKSTIASGNYMFSLSQQPEGFLYRANDYYNVQVQNSNVQLEDASNFSLSGILDGALDIVPLLFNFEYYGGDQGLLILTTVSINENGFITFSGNTQSTDFPLPIPSAIVGLLNDFENEVERGPLGLGLFGSNISYSSNFSRFIVDFDYPSAHFQIILRSNGIIEILLEDVNVENASTGFQQLQNGNELFTMIHTNQDVEISNPVRYIFTPNTTSQRQFVRQDFQPELVENFWKFGLEYSRWDDDDNWRKKREPKSNRDIQLYNLPNYEFDDGSIIIGDDSKVRDVILHDNISLLLNNNSTLEFSSLEGQGTLIIEDGSSILPKNKNKKNPDGEINQLPSSNITTIIKRRKATENPSFFSFLSSPVSNFTTSQLSSNGANSILKLRKGTSVNPQFQFIPHSGVINPGEGYAVNGNFTANFIGTPNNGDIDFPIVANEENGTNGPLNFVGNPYPSAISAKNFLKKNRKVLENGAIYLAEVSNPDFESPEEDRSNNIIIVNGTGASANRFQVGYKGSINIKNYSIPTAQAFQLVAKKSGNLVFENSMRVKGDNSGFRDGEDEEDEEEEEDDILLREAEYVWVSAIQNKMAATTLLAFGAQATDQKDFWYDSKRITGLEGVDIVTVQDEDQFGINTYSNETDSLFIPISLSFPNPGQAKLRISQLQDIDSDRMLLLYDKSRDVATEISRSGDSLELFVPMSGEISDRFAIISVRNQTDNPTSFRTIEEAKFTAYGASGQIVMESELLGQAEVYNLQGQFLQTIQVQAGPKTIQLSNGAYIVRFISHDQSIIRTEKVIVR